MTVLNLDTMDTGQLQHVLKDTGMPQLYQRYAVSRIKSIESRLVGRIDKALRIEKLSEDIYQQMPISIRW